MPKSLQFMDCPECSKRIRTDAARCHHCGHVPWHESQSDDFDYQEFLENEFGKRRSPLKRPWWWYVAWCVLAVFVAGILVDALKVLQG